MLIIFIDKGICFVGLWIVFYWIMILDDEFIILVSFVCEGVVRWIRVGFIGFYFFINSFLWLRFIFIFLGFIRIILIFAQLFLMIFDSSS